MEMERGSASASDTVTMEISAAERAEPQEPVQQPARNHRMLIVVGEVSSSHHLDAARQQIAQGKEERTEEWMEDRWLQPLQGASNNTRITRLVDQLNGLLMQNGFGFMLNYRLYNKRVGI